MSTPLSRSRTVAIVSAILAVFAVVAASLVGSGALVWNTSPATELSLLITGATCAVVAALHHAACLIMQFIKTQAPTPLADHLIEQLGLGSDKGR